MPLIKELIEIPEKVQRGDFVLNLSQGLEGDAVHQTLAQYVVTPQLAKSFEDALSFIKSTVVGSQNRQKGAYLHGSFGSGKSHFMAVLHLLLQGNPNARAIPELAPAVSQHDEWLQQHNILLVPYHMIGAPSIEAGILGGYVRYIKKRHPEAPQPGFYLSDRLFRDAQGMRSKLGDQTFFEILNQEDAAPADDNGWGEVGDERWTPQSFEAVLEGRASIEDHTSLVSALVGTFFQSMSDLANTSSDELKSGEKVGYVDFDEGLRIMTQHAKSLGYDAVVLFLDELILWLASHISDHQFIANNIQKVVKLVEPSEPRALPMASFIARQRDLREFVGDQAVGASQVALSDSLKYWEGRFHTITLEDRNLPVIAQRRLLKPKDDIARQQIQQAFDAIDKSLRDDVHNILLTSQGDREMFRDLYPFSPALIQALVALSSALQRERTALKVMLMLLVDQRDTLELGGVIPVGDLYDVIASEAEPFSEQMRAHFENAKQLFERKLIPLLEAEHGITLAEAKVQATSDAKARAFNNDLRLLKTLLLAALVPEVESFKQLTSHKLAALNHGTIKSPIPGREAQAVMTRCRRWAGQVGEIKIGEDSSNPTIAVQISGVDTESILEEAQIHDSEGSRRKMIKDLVFEAFGIHDDGQLFIEHRWLWRGTWRHVEVLFQNIREIDDFNTFDANGDDWKMIVDFPFDTGNHSPADDRARVQAYLDTGNTTSTLCWLPYFLNQSAQRDLGILVRLDYVLKSDDRFSSFSKHLTPVDRAQARTLLENQRSQLQQRLKDCLLGAYGGSSAIPGTLDDSVAIDEQVMSLEPSFKPRLPHGVNLGQAFEQLLDQALRFQYPEHPEFKTEVRTNDLGKVLAEMRRAVHATNGRIDIEGSMRGLMEKIAEPLGLGTMHERHFVFQDTWPNRLRTNLAKMGQGATSLTVAQLRNAIDNPEPRGLTSEVQNLLILVFMEHGHYACQLHGHEYEPSLKDLPDNLVLSKQELAEPSVWAGALEKAGAILGVSLRSQLRTANHQNDLVRQVRDEAEAYLSSAENLVEVLRRQLSQLGVAGQGQRLATAEYAVSLMDKLRSLEGTALVQHLANSQAPSSDLALGRSLKTAQEVASRVKHNNWALLEKIWEGGHVEAQAIKERVIEALKADELAKPIGPVLDRAQNDATGLIAPAPPVINPPPPTGGETNIDPGGSSRLVRRDRRHGLTRQQARQLFAELEAELADDQVLDVDFTITTREGRDA
ncbi:phage resistance protein [Salinicola halophyticus]|uniref:phage resistance protein n=1 Tax=Salinicola halophyticus TaxID=1808881 RepID=UPI003F48E18F